MKRKLPRSGFELESPIPFQTTIIVALNVPAYVDFIFAWSAILSIFIAWNIIKKKLISKQHDHKLSRLVKSYTFYAFDMSSDGCFFFCP